MSPERSIFPDKKESRVSYESAEKIVKDWKAFERGLVVGQQEATWIANGEYPELPIAITWLPDPHLFQAGTDHDLFNSHIKTILDTPNMFLINGGDWFSNFNPNKYPTAMNSTPLSPQEQAEAVADLLLKLDRKSKLGAIVWGNHEGFSEVAGLSFYRSFCREISCPIYEDGGGVMNLMVGGVHYRGGIRHSYPFSSTLNPTNSPKRLIDKSKQLDFGFVGHTHRASAEMYHVGGEEKVAIVGGTYLLNDSFGNKWGHQGGPGGFTVMFYPDQKRMQIYRDPVIAKEVMRGLIQEHYMNKDDLDPYSEMIQRLNEQRRQKDERARS